MIDGSGPSDAFQQFHKALAECKFRIRSLPSQFDLNRSIQLMMYRHLSHVFPDKFRHGGIIVQLKLRDIQVQRSIRTDCQELPLDLCQRTAGCRTVQADLLIVFLLISFCDNYVDIPQPCNNGLDRRWAVFHHRSMSG